MHDEGTKELERKYEGKKRKKRKRKGKEKQRKRELAAERITMDKEQEKIGIVDQIILAVAKPKQYYKLMSLKSGTVVLYTLLMAFLLMAMTYVIPLTGWLLSYGGFEGFLEKQIPDFTLKDGKLTMNQEIVIKVAGVSEFLVDTSKDKVTVKDLDDSYSQQILVSKSNMIIYSMGSASEVQFDQMKEVQFNKASLSQFVPILYGGAVIMAVVQLVLNFVQYIISAFLYGLIAMAYVGLEGKNVTLGGATKAAIYAKTLAALVGAFNTVEGLVSEGIWSFVAMFLTMLLLLWGIRSKDANDSNRLVEG